MKNGLFFFSLGLLLITNACGPASEDREAMHHRAKVFQDSIANGLRSSMAEAAAPAPNPSTVYNPSPTVLVSGAKKQ